MSGEAWGALGVIVTAAVAFLGHLLLRPKIQAEARKAEAEAQDRDWGRFQREIDRLDRKIAELEAEIAAGGKRERALKQENHRLRNEVMKLSKRVEGLEAIFKIGQVPPDMQAALDKLNERS